MDVVIQIERIQDCHEVLVKGRVPYSKKVEQECSLVQNDTEPKSPPLKLVNEQVQVNGDVYNVPRNATIVEKNVLSPFPLR